MPLINIQDKLIKINKLDNDEYEFIMEYDYIKYYGKSFLKKLNIAKFNDYIDFYNLRNEIILELVSNNYILELPIPFSDNRELVKLNKEEVGEYEDLKIQIKKQDKRIKNLKLLISVITKKHDLLESQYKLSKYTEEEEEEEKSQLIDELKEKNDFSIRITPPTPGLYPWTFTISNTGEKVIIKDRDRQLFMCDDEFRKTGINNIIRYLQKYSNSRFINGEFFDNTTQYRKSYSANLWFDKKPPLKILDTNPKSPQNFINININMNNSGGFQWPIHKLYFE